MLRIAREGLAHVGPEIGDGLDGLWVDGVDDGDVLGRVAVEVGLGVSDGRD
jgi:hypothetical protein